MKSFYRALAELEENGDSGAVCTIVRSQGSTPRHVGSKMLVYPDGSYEGTVGGGEMESRVILAAQEAIADGLPRLLGYDLSDPGRGDPGVCGGQLEVFVEPVTPPPMIVVVGGGHIGRAVAHMAHWLDFRVVVSDDRPEFCTPQAVPDADEYIQGPLADLPESLRITPQTYLVLCTRNVEIDVAGLPALLKTPAAYLGVIGSRRRWETTRKQLMEAGIGSEQLSRVTSPMGLELNAETPEEIAVSILAEIIRLRRGGDGQPMRQTEAQLNHQTSKH